VHMVDQDQLEVALDFDEIFSSEFMRLCARLRINLDGVCKVVVRFERDPLTYDRLHAKTHLESTGDDDLPQLGLLGEIR